MFLLTIGNFQDLEFATRTAEIERVPKGSFYT